MSKLSFLMLVMVVSPLYFVISTICINGSAAATGLITGLPVSSDVKSTAWRTCIASYIIGWCLMAWLVL